MSRRILIGVTKRPETGEWRVFWKDTYTGRDDEGKACYEAYEEDAVRSMVATLRRARGQGQDIGISPAKYTRKLLEKYYPSEGSLSNTLLGMEEVD